MKVWMFQETLLISKKKKAAIVGLLLYAFLVCTHCVGKQKRDESNY